MIKYGTKIIMAGSEKVGVIESIKRVGELITMAEIAETMFIDLTGYSEDKKVPVKVNRLAILFYYEAEDKNEATKPE